MCERAGARAVPDQLRLPRGVCEMNVFVFVFFCPAVGFLKQNVLAAVFQAVVFKHESGEFVHYKS